MFKLLSQTILLERWEFPDGITVIRPTPDGQAWTINWGRKTLTLLDRKGTVIHKINHSSDINDISLSPTTRSLWACERQNNIMELVSGQLTHRFSTRVEPKCICVIASNHVIVGFIHKISKFTTQGQMILTTGTKENGKPLVCTPYRISECPVTHNVAVIDWNYEYDGGDNNHNVIVMDSDFRELFVYRGSIFSSYEQTSHEGARRFWPWSVVYDSVGNIIIGDYSNKRVSLISGSGEFLRILHTDKEDTKTVGVDREDVLWAVYGWYVELRQYSYMCVTPETKAAGTVNMATEPGQQNLPQ